MPAAIPEALRKLLESPAGPDRARAWAAFLEEFSPLLLRVARHLGGGHDVVMDRYAFIVEALAQEDVRRLRSWVSDGRGQFATWLIVVARRLCLDQYRHRYGRPQGGGATATANRTTRRHLVDLISDELAYDKLPGPETESPDLTLLRRERMERLAAVLAALDPSDRLLLRLRFEDAMPVPQIARLVGAQSPFVLYRRFDRLLAGLRARLLDAGIDGPEP